VKLLVKADRRHAVLWDLPCDRGRRWAYVGDRHCAKACRCRTLGVWL